LTPTRIYVSAVTRLLAELGTDVHAMSHITGGGIPGNLPRVLNKHQVARVRLDHERPAIFDIIQRGGPVEEAEMRRTFNLGIGLVVAVTKGQAERACKVLAAAGERAWPIGSVEHSANAEPSVIVEGD
jgi:phosphoribosylformylglycinamidine cyclo-ligase